MGHGANKDQREDAPAARLDAASAAKVATTLQALATPSRLLILTRLREAPYPVTELAEAVGMGQSAVSHQLRLLRNLGLVTGTRSGQEHRLQPSTTTTSPCSWTRLSTTSSTCAWVSQTPPSQPSQ